MGDAGKIGFQCKSGDISDCEEALPPDDENFEKEDKLKGCRGVLVFSKASHKTHTCGKYCDGPNPFYTKPNNDIKLGWTKYLRFKMTEKQ